MTITPIQITSAQYLTSTTAPYYTSASIKTRIDKATLSNQDTSNHTVSAYLTPSGQNVSSASLIIPRRSIAAGTVYHCPELVGHVMAPGDALSLVCDANTVVVFAAAGVTISP